MGIATKNIGETVRLYDIFPGVEYPAEEAVPPVSVQVGQYSAPPFSRFIELTLKDSKGYLIMSNAVTHAPHAAEVKNLPQQAHEGHKIELILAPSRFAAESEQKACLMYLLDRLCTANLCEPQDKATIIGLETKPTMSDRTRVH